MILCNQCGLAWPGLHQGRSAAQQSKLVHELIQCFPLQCLQLYYCLAQFCLNWVVGMSTRERIRGKYGVAPAPCNDCCVAFFCPACGICQEAQEIDVRRLTLHPNVSSGCVSTV